MIRAQVEGSVEAGFEPVRDAFIANFEIHGEVGAAFSVHRHGRPIIDLWGGVTAAGTSDPYTGDTLQMVMSTTKGVVAIAAHILAEEGHLDFDAPVAQYWPEFAAEGKGKMPVRWLFSQLGAGHRARLPRPYLRVARGRGRQAGFGNERWKVRRRTRGATAGSRLLDRPSQ